MGIGVLEFKQICLFDFFSTPRTYRKFGKELKNVDYFDSLLFKMEIFLQRPNTVFFLFGWENSQKTLEKFHFSNFSL